MCKQKVSYQTAPKGAAGRFILEFFFSALRVNLPVISFKIHESVLVKSVDSHQIAP